MTFEEFIAQHDGLSLIKETYNLTDEEMHKSFIDGLLNLILDKTISEKLEVHSHAK